MPCHPISTYKLYPSVQQIPSNIILAIFLLYMLLMFKFVDMSHHLCISDWCIFLKRAGSTESFCCWSISISSTGRKQRVCLHFGENLFLLITMHLSPSLSLSLIVVYPSLHQSYQLAEDLGRAYSERELLQTFIQTEATVPAGSLKVILSNCFYILPIIISIW